MRSRLCVDDLRVLAEDDDVDYARSLEMGLHLVTAHEWDEVLLDHDLGYDPETGRKVTIRPLVLELERLGFEGTPAKIKKITIITASPVGSSWMFQALKPYYDVTVRGFYPTKTMLEFTESIDKQQEERADLAIS